jgi:hypothetical protein
MHSIILPWSGTSSKYETNSYLHKPPFSHSYHPFEIELHQPFLVTNLHQDITICGSLVIPELEHPQVFFSIFQMLVGNPYPI